MILRQSVVCLRSEPHRFPRPLAPTESCMDVQTEIVHLGRLLSAWRKMLPEGFLASFLLAMRAVSSRDT